MPGLAFPPCALGIAAGREFLRRKDHDFNQAWLGLGFGVGAFPFFLVGNHFCWDIDYRCVLAMRWFLVACIALLLWGVAGRIDHDSDRDMTAGVDRSLVMTWVRK